MKPPASVSPNAEKSTVTKWLPNPAAATAGIVPTIVAAHLIAPPATPKTARTPTKTKLKLRKQKAEISRGGMQPRGFGFLLSAFSISAFPLGFLLCLRFRLSAPAFRLLHWAACSLGILTRQYPFMRKWNFSSASFASSISLRS